METDFRSNACIRDGFTGRLYPVQTVRFNAVREQAPVYTMGSPDARSFSRGPRSGAGSFRIPNSYMFETAGKLFDIVITNEEEGSTTVLRNVSIASALHSAGQIAPDSMVTFVFDSADTRKFHPKDRMLVEPTVTNRMAAVLLDKGGD